MADILGELRTIYTSNAKEASKDVLSMASSYRTLNGALQETTTTTKRLDTELNKLMNDTVKTKYNTDGSVKSISEFHRETDVAAKSSNNFSSSLQNVMLQYIGLNALISLGKKIFSDYMDTMKESVGMYRDFDKSLAAVSTTLEKQEMKLMPMYEAAITRLSVQFGQSATDISSGLYEILSAATPAGESLNLLTIATKASIAGLTDVKTSVATLIDVMNAWGYSTSQMVHASDVLFASVLRGKYTFSELEGAIGYVAPIASEAGVSLEEISAAMSSATRRGMHLDSVTRGLALTIQSIIDPTKEASDTAAQYGIDLSYAALQEDGLFGFLKKVNEALGNNKEALSKIFGNMRSYRVVVGLTGEGLGAFAEDMDFMTNSAGKMDEAMAKMADTSKMAADVLDQAIAAVQRRFGEASNSMEMFLKKMDEFKKQMYSGDKGLSTKLFEAVGAPEWTTKSYKIKPGHIDLGDLSKSYFPSLEEVKDDAEITFDSYVEEYKLLVAESVKKLYTEIPKMGGGENKTLFQRISGGEKVDTSGIISDAKQYEIELQKTKTISEEISALDAKKKMGETLTQDETDNLALLNTQLLVQEQRVANLLSPWMEYDALLDDAADAVQRYSDLIEQERLEMADLKSEIGETNILEDGSLGLKYELLYAQNELRKATEELTKAQNANNLEMMELQLAGMKRRRGNTRSELRRMHQLEIEALEQRISDEKGGGELIVGSTDYWTSRVRELQQNQYDSDLEALRLTILGKEERYKELETKVVENYNVMQEAMKTHYDLVVEYFGAESSQVISLIEKYNALNSARKGNIVGTSFTGASTFPGVPIGSFFARLMGFSSHQRGTNYVPYTGIAMLHRGEQVVPSGSDRGNGRNGNVNISINAVIRQTDSVESVCRKIGIGIARGYISGIDTEFTVG